MIEQFKSLFEMLVAELPAGTAKINFYRVPRGDGSVIEVLPRIRNRRLSAYTLTMMSPTLGISPVVQLLSSIVVLFRVPTTEVSSWQIRYRARKSVVKAFMFATATSGGRSITWIRRRTIASIYRKTSAGVPTVTAWKCWTPLGNP